MSVLFDYGEFLLCFAPIFLIIGFIGLALLWNSLPSKGPKAAADSVNEGVGEQVDE